MRIAFFQLGYETNTFTGGLAALSDLGTGDWIKGSQLQETFRGTHTGLGGILDALKDMGAEGVPMDSMSRGGAFNAGPLLSKVCVEEAVGHVCRELTLRQDAYDGVCIAMHGAGCGEGYEDVDGYLLERIRQVVGKKPVFASLDLHANISRKMVENADCLFGITTLPHTDFYETAYRAATCLCQTLEGKLQPKMAFCPIPMLVPSAFATTLTGVGKEIRTFMESYAREKGLVYLSFFHSFSGTDSPCTSASVIAVADGRCPEQEAKEAALYVWSRRQEYVRPTMGAAQAVDAALTAVKAGYVVINDGNDNPGGGNPGDGTYLLAEFIKRDLPGFIMGPLLDPAAAEICHAHKLGDVFSLEVGGRTDPAYGAPLQLEVKLLALSDGCFTCVSPMYQGSAMCYGPSARLQVGNVEFIVVSRRFQTYDDQPFLMTGADLKNYRVVGLKSQNHFRAYFAERAGAMVAAHTPGAFPADVRELDYQRVQRPMFPLDPDTTFAGCWDRS